MRTKLVWFKDRLPEGYNIVVWKTATGENRYSTFQGDDRLMSFKTRTEAVNYATQHNQEEQLKHGLAASFR